MSTCDILIVDDDESLSEMLSLHIDDIGLTTHIVHTGAEAKSFLAKNTCKLVLLDQHLPDTNGLKLLQWLLENDHERPVVMVTGFHDMKLVITAMKTGAFDYVHKPIDLQKLDTIIHHALKADTKKAAVNTAPAQEDTTPEITGSSTEMIEVCKKIAIATQNNANVLIQGASGTGKELVAKAIHSHGEHKGPFVAVNCASIVDTLLESELFGHEKGAFTGADQTKQGRFEIAEDGTLFLDEIGEMSPHLQAKLLRVLQEQTFERVGSNKTLATNARIIAATHRDLRKMVAAGKFREDLFYRLDVIGIYIPTLKERMSDFPEIVSNLLMRINHSLGKTIKGITLDGMVQLKAQPWTGNIRELENVLTRAAAHTQQAYIDVDDINSSLPTTTETNLELSPATSTQLISLEEVEKAHILNVLEATGNHKGKTCNILNISRPALDRKLKKWQAS